MTDPKMPEPVRKVSAAPPFAVFDEFGKGCDDEVADHVRAYAEVLAAARVAQERERCAGAEAAREQRWIEWLVEHGLLHYYQSCQRPDRSHGPAWVLRTPYMTNGDSCEAWHADSAAGALRSFLRAQDTQPPETGKEG